MTNFSKTSLSPVEDGLLYDDIAINTQTSTISRDGMHSHVYYFIIMIAIISLIGLPGNGIVIYLLGFRIKRTPFTTYILNLAVADFGFLLSFLTAFFPLIFQYSQLYFPLIFEIEYILLFTLVPATFMQSSSQLLLTAISIDRCVSVLFPIWHRCHRPPYLSTIVCALMWVLAGLPAGSLAIFLCSNYLTPGFVAYPFIAISALCLLLITMSTTILFLKVFCKVQQSQRGRVLSIVLITLLFFLIFAFPLNALLVVSSVTTMEFVNLILYGFLCASLNSFVNPVIYCMVGRKKRGQQRQSLKVILQRAFKEEEEEQRQEQGPTAQMSL